MSTFLEFAQQHPYMPELGDIHEHNQRVRALWWLETGEGLGVAEISQALKSRTDDPVAAVAGKLLAQALEVARGEGSTKDRQKAVWNLLDLSGAKRDVTLRNLDIALVVERLGVAGAAEDLDMDREYLARIRKRLGATPVFSPCTEVSTEDLIHRIRNENGTPSPVD